jgi:hypothetical protein
MYWEKDKVVSTRDKNSSEERMGGYNVAEIREDG